MNSNKFLSQSDISLEIYNIILKKSTTTFTSDTLCKENQDKELIRRIKFSWAVFGNLEHIFKNKDILINLKGKVYKKVNFAYKANKLTGAERHGKDDA